MQDCTKYGQLANLAVDRLLTPDQEKSLETHLSTCPDCQRRIQAAQAIKEAVSDLEVETPETLVPGTLFKTSAEASRKPVWRRYLPQGIGFLAAACVIVVVVVLNQTGVFSGLGPSPKALEGNSEYASDQAKTSGSKSSLQPNASPASSAPDPNAFSTNDPLSTDNPDTSADNPDASVSAPAGSGVLTPEVLFDGQKVYTIMMFFGDRPTDWNDYPQEDLEEGLFVLVPRDEFEAFKESVNSYALADDSPDFDPDSDYAMVVFLK